MCYDCEMNEEFLYQKQDGEDNHVNFLQSEGESMNKKIEVEVENDADKNGIITKQSEVYVWDDQVFASYKSALVASKKAKILETAVQHMYPTYSAAQVKKVAKTWEASPHCYYIYADKLISVCTELLAE